MRHSTRLRGLAAATLIAATAIIVVSGSPATAAGADTNLMTCTGTQTTTYNPGLLTTNQVVDKSGENIWPICTGTDPEITSASSEFDAQDIELSCVSPLGSGTGSQTIEWSDGTESTFEWSATRSVTPIYTTTILAGSLTAGTFAGSNAVQTIVAPLFVNCLVPPGTTQDIGSSTLVLTNL